MTFQWGKLLFVWTTFPVTKIIITLFRHCWVPEYPTFFYKLRNQLQTREKNPFNSKPSDKDSGYQQNNRKLKFKNRKTAWMTVLLETKGFKLIHRNAKKLAIQNRNTGLSYRNISVKVPQLEVSTFLFSPWQEVNFNQTRKPLKVKKFESLRRPVNSA